MAFSSLLFASALLALASAKTPTLILYENGGYGGASRTLHGPTEYLGSIGFNDAVSSIHAESGEWEMYENAGYQGGRMVIAEGQRGGVNVNDWFSSARPVCRYEADPTTSQLRVYVDFNRQGDSKDFLVAEDNLSGWHDKISSVVAMKGDWELYEHTGFQGVREVIREGQQVNLALNDAHSSLRPICETYSIKRKCVLEKIEVIDNGQMEPQYAGTQIIGSADSGTCYGPGSITLILGSADTVEESFSLEIAEENEINWSASVTVEVEAAAKFLGAGGSVTVGVSVGVGGSHSVSKSETKSYNTGNERVVGQETEYSTPGAAIVFGAVDRFTIDKSDTPVKMHMRCPDGDNYVKTSTMKLQSTKFQSAHFWPLVGSFNSAACRDNRNLPECVRGVKRRHSHFLGKKEEIRADFDRCFADGKGSTGM